MSNTNTPNQAWQITSASQLTLTNLPTPSPGPHQALLRVQAVSINFRDHLIIAHSPSYPVQAKSGLVPASDAAGTIVSVGPSSIWKAGDRVIVHSNNWLDGDVRNFDVYATLGGGDADGTLTRYMVVDDIYLIKSPDLLSADEGSTLFTAGVTAWNMLFCGPEKFEKGMTVLTQGTGGVSTFAIQLAAAAGATVIATSSSDDKLHGVKSLGAMHGINYKTTPEWATKVLELTNGKGVDHVIEVGGAGTIEQSLQATRFGGLVTVAGILTESQKADLIPAILFGSKTIRGSLGAGSKEMHQAMANFLAEKKIHPGIAKTFDFEEADKAFEFAKNSTAVGKVVIRC